MPNESYWQGRQEQKFLAGEKKVKDYYTGLEKAFEQAKREIQRTINDFVTRYEIENGVTGGYAKAQQLLNKTELGELQDFIDMVRANMGDYNQDINNMSYKARITRYEALLQQVDATLQQLYSIDYQAKGEDILNSVYTDAYYQTWFNIDQYHGFHQEFAQVSAKTIEELIRYPFNGANFSTRLWKQKDHMLQQLTESITTMLIQGRNPMTLAGDFSKKFKTKEFEAYRLLHTEGSFMTEQGTLAGYKEDGVEKYKILATLDMKTSDICREADSDIYDIAKAVVGVNYPPLHIFCRSTTVPYYEESDNTKDFRVARDPVTGRSYEVPAGMKYEQWHKKFVEENPQAMIAEKKWNNRYADKKQFSKYKDILGNDIPKYLDDFQNLKYTDEKEWNLTKYNYKLRNNIKTGAAEPLRNSENLHVAEAKYTGYLFNPNNETGYAKGKAFTSRLGYDVSNYKELDTLIKNSIGKYPANSKGNTEYGEKYEVNMVLKGLTGKQAKVKAGIMLEKGTDIPKLTTVFIDKLKESD